MVVKAIINFFGERIKDFNDLISSFLRSTEGEYGALKGKKSRLGNDYEDFAEPRYYKNKSKRR